MKRVFDEVSDLVGDKDAVKLKLHPAFASGSVSAKVPCAEFDGEKLSRLKEVLSHCSTFAIDPLTNGSISISATVQNVFERN